MTTATTRSRSPRRWPRRARDSGADLPLHYQKEGDDKEQVEEPPQEINDVVLPDLELADEKAVEEIDEKCKRYG